MTLGWGIWHAFGTNLLAASDWIAPGVPGAFGVGLTVSYVFLQSVHYLVWLVIVPAEERPGSGSVSFRRSFRDLARELGAPVGRSSRSRCGRPRSGSSARRRSRRGTPTSRSRAFHVWLELAVLARHAVDGPARLVSMRAPRRALA